MFKTALVIITVLLLSCNQHAENSSGVATQDSSTGKPSVNEGAPDTSSLTTDSLVKHEAYNADITNLPPTLRGFVTPGYTALDTTSGDLNLDSYPDMIMVLKKNGEETSSNVNEHPEKRPLLLLLGKPDNGYKLSGKSDNLVYCIDCGGAMGDPFTDVVIKKGYFSVEHSGGSSWRWNRTTTFKYAPSENTWYLHKDVNESFHSADPGKTETKVHSPKDLGKVPFDRFDIYKEDE